MAERNYVDFDVQLEWVGTAYRARVLDSPGGQAHADVSLPFSDLEIENFLLKMGQRRGIRRRAESKELDAAREFGAKLFEAILRDDVLAVYRNSLNLAEQQDAGLRIRLRLSGAPRLVEVPWEFLYDPSARRFVALSSDSPIVRFLDLPGSSQPLKVTPPLRILVVISSPNDFEPLQVEAEWERLQEAVAPAVAAGQLSIERLPKATLAELQRAFRRDYHVLHFVGHGGFDEQGQDGLLVFEDDFGRGNEVSATYLATLLHDADTLRLAVLNACDGARSSTNDQFAGVAQSLLQQGVPAVVAMQFEISDAAALTFAREFYGAFAEGFPVEAALAEARKSMFAQQNDSEWATPVLYLRTAGGSIFDIQPVFDPGARTIFPPPGGLAPDTGSALNPLTGPVSASEVTQVAPTIVDRSAAPPTQVWQTPPPFVTPLPPSPEPATEPEPEMEPEPLTESAGPPPILGTGDGGSRRGKGKVIAGVVAGALLTVALLAVIGAMLLPQDNEPADEDDDDETATASPRRATATLTTGPVVVLPVDFTGEWWTNFARVELTQTGMDVTGEYYRYLADERPTPLKGIVDGTVLTGTFAGDVNPFVFTISDDRETFMGHWASPNGDTHEWCGNLEFKEMPEGCGYSGDWQVKGFPPAAALDGDSIYITQFADSASVSLQSTRYKDVEFTLQFDSTTLARAAGTVRLALSDQPTVQIQLDWLVTEDPNWDSFTGRWSSGTQSGVWCGFRHDARPPC